MKESSHHQLIQRIEHLNKVLRGIRNVNQMIVIEEDSFNIIEKACVNLTESMGYELAWIILFEEDNPQKIQHVAVSSKNSNITPLLKKFLLSGNAICLKESLRTGDIIITNTSQEQCKECPLKEYSNTSSFSIALKFQSKIYGVISVLLSKEYSEDLEEQNLFKELAGDIAFALHKIQLNKLLNSLSENYKLLFREMMDAFALHEIITDENGTPINYRFLDVNPSFEKMTGLRKEDILGKTILEIFPKLEKIWIERYGEVALTGKPQLFEEYSGVLNKWFIVNAFSPKPMHFACIFSDITEKKNYEKKILEEKEWAEKIISSAPVIIVALGENSKIIIFNKFAEKITGYMANEVIGKPWIDIFIPENQKKQLWEVWNQVVQEKAISHNYENPILTKNASEKLIRWSNTVIQENNKFKMVLSIGEDITEAKRLEEEKLTLIKQLHQTQKMETIGKLAGGIAHDINNMLSVIIGFCELAMEETKNNQSIQNNLNEIFKAAKKSADITKQLLTFARKQPISPKIVNPNEEIENILKMLKRLIGENIKIIWKPSSSWNIYADSSQIDQIITNLCVNAKDAIGNSNGEILIQTENITVDELYCRGIDGATPGDYVAISITDNGCGIPENIIDKIFDPFFTTKDIGKGTGLGLSIVYGIVRQNNAFITVYSKPGRGSSFKVFFPRIEKIEKTTDENISIKPGEEETVFVVEDEPAIVEFIKLTLENLNYKVFSSNSPRNALEIIEEKKKKIQLLITDVIMPEMNGQELVNEIRKIYPDLKVLFISGYSNDETNNFQNLLKDNRNDFLTKPFTKNELIQKINNIFVKNEKKN
ncbi:MAG TPA: PAS domain S-box protein [Victivallales bacterium]|nr:PAS domain S-box protein [Victivallales bacterium]HPO90252.1 PAS domain S-box protein [Victivallales bacterium]HRR29060.1 PAS domain S-box protein [Victivallales bacterium]